MTIFDQVIEQARAQTWLEVVAVCSAIAYLLLAIRERIACWFFAALSTAIFVWLYFDAKLYMESVLNVFYFLMAGYGWYRWTNDRGNQRTKAVVIWPARRHGIAITTIVIISAINGALLSRYTDAVYPFVDSLTTWSAIWATFLVARKVLENWWYLLLIDAVSVVIFWLRDLQLTSLLFVAYLVMIPFGLHHWTKSMREQQRQSAD